MLRENVKQYEPLSCAAFTFGFSSNNCCCATTSRNEFAATLSHGKPLSELDTSEFAPCYQDKVELRKCL